MENLTERDFRDNSISCPNCDNHDLVFLGNGQYRCNSCGCVMRGSKSGEVSDKLVRVVWGS